MNDINALIEFGELTKQSLFLYKKIYDILDNFISKLPDRQEGDIQDYIQYKKLLNQNMDPDIISKLMALDAGNVIRGKHIQIYTLLSQIRLNVHKLLFDIGSVKIKKDYEIPLKYKWLLSESYSISDHIINSAIKEVSSILNHYINDMNVSSGLYNI